MGRQLRGSIMLFMTALIWGVAFVAQKSGMDSVSPVAFNGIRTLIGAVALLPVIYIMNRIAKSKGRYHKETPQERKTLWIGGACCGLALCAAGNIQQIGLYYTSVSHTGFITAPDHRTCTLASAGIIIDLNIKTNSLSGFQCAADCRNRKLDNISARCFGSSRSYS